MKSYELEYLEKRCFITDQTLFIDGIAVAVISNECSDLEKILLRFQARNDDALYTLVRYNSNGEETHLRYIGTNPDESVNVLNITIGYRGSTSYKMMSEKTLSFNCPYIPGNVKRYKDFKVVNAGSIKGISSDFERTGFILDGILQTPIGNWTLYSFGQKTKKGRMEAIYHYTGEEKVDEQTFAVKL